ncbi:hypothetical protein C8J57DRAFT_948667, partial [Mycena rebaudengoi]
ALGDLLAQGATALLEFLQPYPGDERPRKAFRDADEPRFSVVPISETEYSIYDGFYDELVNLPTYLLRNPSFRLADWFAKKRAADLGLLRQPRPLHRVPVGDLLANGVSQYFD